VQITDQNEGGIDTSKDERENNLINGQEHDQYGYPLSCEDTNSTFSSEEED
jgi:hypothetical protein